MKKVFPVVWLFCLLSFQTYGCELPEYWIEIPQDFKETCYEKSWDISIDIKQTICPEWNTFFVNSNQEIDTFIWNNEIIPFKLFSSTWDSINYIINIEWTQEYLTDNNLNTHIIYDTTINKELNIEFTQEIHAGTFDFTYKIEADYYKPSFHISLDGVNYFQVDYKNIPDYDIKSMKILFNRIVKDITNEKIKIQELLFRSKWYTYIVQSTWSLTYYWLNKCNDSFPNLSNYKWDFSTNIDSPIYEVVLENNPDYDIISDKDSDNDGIPDSKDNCPEQYNPQQKDNGWDGVWDVCSDDDNDGIIGYKDNCIYNYNPDQLDINQNNVGDVCEFDKDSDGIFDSQDNCINNVNPDQKDDDNDSIWNACDNCESYNPSQLDADNNGIWDRCEQQQEHLEENDDDSDGIINYKDNCRKIANPDQADSDEDGVWDACDNCKTFQNSKQLDENENGIWDICEDSDGDGIDGIQDNCINIANPDQADSDNDGIWNVCEDDDRDNIFAKNDNCPFTYNPDQMDVDTDGIWDVCDENDDRYIESNSTFFIWLLVIVTLIFWIWIYFMIRKLNNNS